MESLPVYIILAQDFKTDGSERAKAITCNVTVNLPAADISFKYSQVVQMSTNYPVFIQIRNERHFDDLALKLLNCKQQEEHLTPTINCRRDLNSFLEYRKQLQPKGEGNFFLCSLTVGGSRLRNNLSPQAKIDFKLRDGCYNAIKLTDIICCILCIVVIVNCAMQHSRNFKNEDELLHEVPEESEFFREVNVSGNASINRSPHDDSDHAPPIKPNQSSTTLENESECDTIYSLAEEFDSESFFPHSSETYSTEVVPYDSLRANTSKAFRSEEEEPKGELNANSLPRVPSYFGLPLENSDSVRERVLNPVENQEDFTCDGSFYASSDTDCDYPSDPDSIAKSITCSPMPVISSRGPSSLQSERESNIFDIQTDLPTEDTNVRSSTPRSRREGSFCGSVPLESPSFLVDVKLTSATKKMTEDMKQRAQVFEPALRHPIPWLQSGQS